MGNIRLNILKTCQAAAKCFTMFWISVDSHVPLMHQIIVDHLCLSTPGQNHGATTPPEHYNITFPPAGENDPNQLISPNKTTRKQILNPADPELQPYSTDKTCFDLDLKDLALHFWTPPSSSQIPRGLCKPYCSSLWITRMQEQWQPRCTEDG